MCSSYRENDKKPVFAAAEAGKNYIQGELSLCYNPDINIFRKNLQKYFTILFIHNKFTEEKEK